MNIEFIDEKDLPASSGRKSIYANQLSEFLAELREHPDAIGRWAKVPFLLPHASLISSRWKQKHSEFDFRMAGGNHLAINDPAKKSWVVYVKYEPKG